MIIIFKELLSPPHRALAFLFRYRPKAVLISCVVFVSEGTAKVEGFFYSAKFILTFFFQNR